MKKNNLIGLILAIVIIIVFLIILFSGSEKKDIDVNVMDITY